MKNFGLPVVTAYEIAECQGRIGIIYEYAKGKNILEINNPDL